MKKSKYLALGLSLVLALSACGGQTAPEPEEPKQEIQQAEPVKMETPVPPIETEPEAEPENMEPVEVQTDEVEDNETAPIEEEPAVDLFTEVNEIVYATGAVNLRSGPGTTYDKVGSLATGDSVTRTGIGTGEAENWSRVMLASGEVVYVSSNYLSLTKPAVQQAQPASSGSSGGSGGSGTQQAQEASSETSGDLSAEDEAAMRALLASRGHLNLDMSGTTDYSPESTSKGYTEGWNEHYR